MSGFSAEIAISWPECSGTGILPVLLRGWAFLMERADVDGMVNSADASDIQASLNGDADAYARLVRRHQDKVAKYLWRFTRSRATVEELTQEVFVQAYFGLSRFRGEAPFERWLRRIATRVGYRHWKTLRRRRVEVGLTAEDWERVAGLQVDAPVEAETAGALLHGLLSELPPRDRLVLTLMYIEGHSVAEAAELIGWTQTMVKVQAFRARGKLRRLLESRGVRE